MTDQRRQVEIEQLLQWCYRDELPKKYMSSAEGIWAEVEERGHNGGIAPNAPQRYFNFGLPHPDAITIEKAVSALPDHPLDWQSEAADLLGPLVALVMPRRATELPTQRFSVASWGYGPHKVKERVEPPRGVLAPILRPAALVTMHAKMGSRPPWFDDIPIVLPIPAVRGPNAMIIGQCWARNVYAPGSYCPIEWSPDPVTIAEDRADYLAWHRALQHLATTLELGAHIVLPPTAPEFPWRDRETCPRDHQSHPPPSVPSPPPPTTPDHGPTATPAQGRKGKKHSNLTLVNLLTYT